MTLHMSAAEFDHAVDDAMASIPEDLLKQLDNVAILVQDEPDSDMPGAPYLLGLYVGVPLPQRSSGYGFGNLPDRIYIFKGPLSRQAHNRTDLLRQIRVTVLHEIGHYFGIDDARLHELGWG